MEGIFSFWCYREQDSDLPSPRLMPSWPGQPSSPFQKLLLLGKGNYDSRGCGFWGLLLQTEHEQNGVCYSGAGAGEAVVWVYLAQGSHDTLGNKHSHFLSGRLPWINKQHCRAALFWNSRDKPQCSSMVPTSFSQSWHGGQGVRL